MSKDIAEWMEAAKRLPLAFAQVREDPELDFRVLERLGRRARVAMIASGGCTAAALSTRPDVESLLCVDPNPAQLALGKLKLHLLRTAEPAERLRLLGHAPLDAATRTARLAEMLARLALAADALGPAEPVATHGPDHAGRYEFLFAALRGELAPVSAELEAVLGLGDAREQARRTDPETPLGGALDAAFAKVMSLPNLVALFGEGATRNPREPFAMHFARRLRSILAAQPAAGNPFLSQMLLGRFAPGFEHFWLRSPVVDAIPPIQWEASTMVPALRRRPGEFDLVHLSNILDWLDPDQATETLESAHAALRPGGWVIVRQLNSVLDLPSLCSGFAWDTDAGAALLARDRSFFYRTIWVGRRK